MTTTTSDINYVPNQAAIDYQIVNPQGPQFGPHIKITFNREVTVLVPLLLWSDFVDHVNYDIRSVVAAANEVTEETRFH